MMKILQNCVKFYQNKSATQGIKGVGGHDEKQPNALTSLGNWPEIVRAFYA